jgi:6-phosphogluconolactonase
MKVTFLAALAVGFALLFGGTAMANGVVYTQTNSTTGNAVWRLERGGDDSLAPVALYRTGGLGTGAGLGSQGAVALSEDGRVVAAVDAGSNDVAVFRVGRRGHLTLIDRAASGGTMPVSADIDRGTLYVLNAGGATPGVSVFDLDGGVRVRARGTTALPAGSAGAAQVSVSPDGRSLVVTERTANRIDTFPLRLGRLGEPEITPSSGAVPFGFAFSPRGDLIVSEAGASTVSSYRNGRLTTASLPVGQGAACWVAVTPDGKFAYTGNATGSISGFAIARDGSLSAVTADGRTASSPRPNDVTIAGGYLYVVNPLTGEVTAYRIGVDGSLTQQPGATDLGTSLAGLAAR